MKNCGLWKGLTLERFTEDYLLLEEPDTWSEQENKKEVAETIHDEETAAPVPCPPIAKVREE